MTMRQRRLNAVFLISFFYVCGHSGEISAAPGVLQMASGEPSCFLLEDHSLYCWGSNESGELGLGSPAKLYLTPQKVKLPKKPRTIDTGAGKTCVIYEDGSLSCWGSNVGGALGRGSKQSSFGRNSNETPDKLFPIDLGKKNKVSQVSIGTYHTCVILEDSSIKCWGDNEFGQLGLGHTKALGNSPADMGDNLPSVQLGDAKPVSVIASHHFTCVLLANNEVKCWGYYGAIGSGATTNLGTELSHMGNKLKSVNFGTNKKVFKFSAGPEHSCVVLTDASVKCWGRNLWGSLGIGLKNGVTIGDSQDELGDNLKSVPLGGLHPVDISCGDKYCCAKFENNAIKCWGWGGYGILGLEDYRNRGEKLSDMGDNLPFVNLGRLFEVIKMNAAGTHSCAQNPMGEVKCWGNGSYGQLGYGSQNSIGGYPNQMGDKLLPLSFE